MLDGWELGIALGDAVSILLGMLLGSSDGVLDGSKHPLLGKLLGASDDALTLALLVEIISQRAGQGAFATLCSVPGLLPQK